MGLKEVLREYNLVLISIIGCIFGVIGLSSCLFMLSNNLENYKPITDTIEITKENNKNYEIKIDYPKGNFIRLVKDEEFVLSDYVQVEDSKFGLCETYNYKLYQDGVNIERFNTDVCGGYRITMEIYYREVVLQGVLQIIVEER